MLKSLSRIAAGAVLAAFGAAPALAQESPVDLGYAEEACGDQAEAGCVAIFRKGAVLGSIRILQDLRLDDGLGELARKGLPLVDKDQVVISGIPRWTLHGATADRAAMVQTVYRGIVIAEINQPPGDAARAFLVAAMTKVFKE